MSVTTACASMELCQLKTLPCTSTHACPSCNLNVHAMCGEICEEASLKFQTTCFKCFAMYGKAFKDPAAAIQEASQKPAATQRSTAVKTHRLRGNPVNEPLSEDATYIPKNCRSECSKTSTSTLKLLKKVLGKRCYHSRVSYAIQETTSQMREMIVTIMQWTCFTT